MDRSKIKNVIITFFVCYLIGSCIIHKVKAEDVVTGNILPNAGNSVSSYNSGTTPVISDNTSDTTMSNNTTLDGFAITCDTANGQNGGCGAFFTYDKAVEAAHDLKITSTATLVGINGTGQTSNDTITSTADKLDNGITLDSTIDMQNCEWSGSAFRCGDSTGAVDSYTVKVRILDSSDEELATVTQTRTTDAGYYANSETFTDQLIYTGTGASKYEWSWKGVDGSGSTSSHANQRGPNLLGAKLLMTFDSEDYVTISTESQTALTSVATVFTELEETFSEEISAITTGELVTFSMEIEEEASFEETFSFEEESFEEEVFEETAMEEEVFEEEIIEEEASFEESTMEPPQEEVMEETEMTSEEEEVMEEEETEMTSEEEGVEEESTEMVEETNEEEEEATEEESTSETATTSTVSSEKNSKQKKVQSKKTLTEKLDRLMAKVDEEVKDSAKNLALKNIIKLKAIASEQASLDLYKNTVFYRPKDIYLEQLNIFDNRQIYDTINLASYIKKDKVAIKAKILHEINLKKQKLLIELEQLKNGKI